MVSSQFLQMQTGINTDFICHLSITQISSGQDVCYCRISSNHHKVSRALCKEERRINRQILGAWRISSSGNCMDKITHNLFHTFKPLPSMPKKNWNFSLAKHHEPYKPKIFRQSKYTSVYEKMLLMVKSINKILHY